MARRRVLKAYDAGVADGLADHGTDPANWRRTPRLKGRRKAAYGNGWVDAYDGSVRETRRAHRRLTGRH